VRPPQLRENIGAKGFLLKGEDDSVCLACGNGGGAVPSRRFAKKLAMSEITKIKFRGDALLRPGNRNVPQPLGPLRLREAYLGWTRAATAEATAVSRSIVMMGNHFSERGSYKQAYRDKHE